MTGADWVLLAVVGTGTLLGLRCGVIAGVLDLVAVGIGLGATLIVVPWIDDRMVGIGVEHRGLLIGLAFTIFSIIAAVVAATMRIAFAPLELARKVPPFGLLNSILGAGPGLVKGGLVAIMAILILLLQFPSTTYAERVRASATGELLAELGSIGFERAANLTGSDLHGLTARRVGPGQVVAGTASLPDGDLDRDEAAESEAYRLVDAAREADGRAALDRDDDLAAFARAHAGAAQRQGDRRLPSGVADVGDRLAASGRNCLAVGAVLGAGDTVSGIVDELLRSLAHREVMLSGTYLRVGIAVLTGDGGESILVGVFTL